MDSTSLTKPVDLQGLSLALAKTKADYEAQINQVAVQSDWEMDDEGSVAYILNRPAIRAGDGEGSIVEGYLETNSDAKSYSLTITGSGCDFTYTTENEITESANAIKNYGLIFDENDGSGTFYYIRNIDLTNHTIRISRSYSGGEKTRQVTLFYKTRLVKGKDAHAEGVNTLTCSVGTHAEGNWSMALSSYAHAEGFMSRAGGVYSHAEGGKTEALGLSSHAEGTSTIAIGNHQHVQGKYNIEDDSNTYAHIVGNGTSESNRSNAHTLDWSGNAWYAGKVSAGTVENPANPTAANDLATKAYVDDHAGVTTLSGLTDTTITSASDGQILTYDNTNSKWINSNIPKDVFLITATATYNSAAPDLFDYTFDKTYNEITAAYNAGKICLVKYSSEYYYYEGETSSNILFLSFYKDSHYDIYYINTFVITSSNNVSRYNFKVPQELADLKNVSIQSPHSGQSLIYSSGGNWKNGYIELTQLSDTTISSPTNGQVLTYDSTTSKWINSNTLTETRVNELIAAALAQYGDGDTASYGYTDASEVNY